MIEFPNLNEVTIESLLKMKESQIFERKSADIKAKKISQELIAFANADGGLLAIGIDNNGRIEGINSQGNTKINDFIQCKIDHCVPPVKAEYAFIPTKNDKGEEDRILLIQVEPAVNMVHKTKGDRVFLRVGDESKELNHDHRLSLEYDKGDRMFEEQIVSNCSIEDLDDDMLKLYSDSLGYTGESNLEPLFARGFINKTNKGYEITVAGVLLFAKNPTKFLPSARIRFIRYEGGSEEVGTAMNIIKNEYVEGPLPLMIEKTKSIVKSQLREFTALNPIDGRFRTVPEYPEFAWLEAIVNAVTHRAYHIQGDDIKIKMFDDRLEISSPGKFPHIVNRKTLGR